MECLGIPIDHRLRRTIRRARIELHTGNFSKHVEILHAFGASLEREGAPGTAYLSIPELSFGIEMAKPASKGRVLVALCRPYSKQRYSGGFVTSRDDCSTIRAVSELISAVNDRKFGFDDVSTFDAIPFLHEGIKTKFIIQQSQRTFAEMIEAKQPDVVLCCFQEDEETPNELVQDLRSIKVGRTFEQPILEYGPSLSLIRVNAFHPSYAINYNPTYSCFRQLLTLEFTKAFALWRNDWKEEDWMTTLRDVCRGQAKHLYEGNCLL